MEGGNSEGQQPGSSRRNSSPVEQPSASLERKDERSDDLNQPGPSNAKRGGQLFTSDKENQPGDSDSKKQRNSGPDHQPTEVDQNIRSTISNLDKSNEDPGHGIKNSLHGLIYQLKLLMLFLKQGLNKGYSFRLGTEIEAAGKFDDVVFQYKNVINGEMVFRFLQAKHKQGEKTKISENDLLKETNKKLCLQKYFISYRKIKNNPEFNGEIKDLIICTNNDFCDYLQNSFEPVLDEDDILDVVVDAEVNECEKPKRLKLKKSCSLREEKLKSMLEKASDLHRLAKELAKCIFSTDNNVKKIYLKDTIKDHYKALVVNVFDIDDTETTKFQEDFIDESPKLSEKVKKFRKLLLDESNSTEDDFKRKLKDMNLEISDEFRNVFKLKENPEITNKTNKSSSKSPAQGLAEKIVGLIFRNKAKESIKLKDPMIKENIAELAGHVFIQAENATKFRQGFLDDDVLPGNLNDFREALEAELLRKGMQLNQLAQYQFKIKVPTCSEQDYDKYRNNELYFQHLHPLPDDKVANQEIEDFLDRLVFAVNQPNEDALSKLINVKIGDDFNLINSDFIASNFQIQMLDWVKAKNVSFLTHEEGQAFFDEAKQKLSQLILLGPTLDYRTKIENFGIAFKEVPRGLQSFLTDNVKNILNLSSSHQTVLGSIKVYQTLITLPKYQKNDSHTFISLSSLLRIQNHVINAFNSEETHHLLVIECDAADGNVEELYNQLSKTVLRDGKKKVILITQRTNCLVEKFQFDFSSNNIYDEQKDGNNSFTNLTPKSQNILLNERQIVFQGKEITLRKLMEIKDVNILTKEELAYLDEMIDPAALVQLMRNEVSIEVGTKKPHLSDLESIYYVASVTINVEQILCAVRNNPFDLFVIGGTTKYEFSKLIIKSNNKEYTIRVLGEDVARKEDKFIILTNKNKEKNLEDFKQICSDHSYIKHKGFSAHFIENKNNELIWKRSYDASFYIPRNLYHVVIKKDSLEAHITLPAEIGAEKKDIFAISSIEEREFAKQYEIVISEIENVSTEADSNKKNHVIILKDEKKENSFEDLCSNECLAHYNMHLLQNKDSTLVWRRSKGEMTKIHEMRDTQSEFPINKDDLNKITDTEKAIVIAGEPGMGKSTTLTHLLKQPEELEWIIKLNLINLKKQLMGLYGVNDLYRFIEIFFSRIDMGVKGKVAKGLLKYRIEHQGKITLLFDGFDEVTDENQKAVINLLTYLKNTKAKIQITTRLNVKDKLEDALSVFSYSFQPFSEKNQRKFLHNFWKASIKLTINSEINNDILGKIVSELFKHFYINIKDKKFKFMSIPLLTRMCAEIYQESVEKTYHSGGQIGSALLKEIKKLSMLDLYRQFINRKYEIYINEKMKIEEISNYVKAALNKSLNKDHQRLAFRKLFSKFEQIEILADKRKLFTQKKILINDFKLVGIVQSINSEGDPYFIHQTFAEYFAAGLFADMLGRTEDNPKYKVARNFLVTQIFKDRNKVIRHFFENMVKEKHDLNRKWKIIKSYDLSRILERKGVQFSRLSSHFESMVPVCDKSLSELKQELEYIGSIKQIRVNFLQKYLEETDINKLKMNLEFLIKTISNPLFFSKFLIHNQSNFFLPIIKHYLTQAKQKNQLDNEFVMGVLTSLKDEIGNYNREHIDTFDRYLAEFESSFWRQTKKKSARNLIFHVLQGSKEISSLLFFIMKLSHPDIEPYIIENIDRHFNNLKYQFFSMREIEKIMCYEIFTDNMSKLFCSKLDKVRLRFQPIDFDIDRTFSNLISPILDIKKTEQLPGVDSLAFLKMLVHFTTFSVEHYKQCIFITPEQLKTALDWMIIELEQSEPVDEMVSMCAEFLLALAKAGLKLFDIDEKLLVFDVNGDLQYELPSCRELIVRSIKRKLEMMDTTNENSSSSSSSVTDNSSCAVDSALSTVQYLYLRWRIRGRH